ncbi:AI-2E family transporter [Undibacterium sp. RTI2.1]|uniref:AI-2E family transporter n=1 Tax=unclassified Undibacterium TaxID=2630295 RepID=UPI002B23D955|nr:MULTISPECIES: AI-2E family transporter [unclassified Undibacterium]MEB0032218.1 AI-2E family transporter [Undibacterium sp. RTI2.1]
MNPKTSPDKLAKLVGAATVLGMLYFGREFLIPITLAVILSLLIAPLIRRMRHIGFGHAASVIVSVVTLTLALSTLCILVGVQVIQMGASLPKYEETIRGKLRALDQLTLGKLNALTGQADRVMDGLSDYSKPVSSVPESLAPAETPTKVASNPKHGANKAANSTAASSINVAANGGVHAGTSVGTNAGTTTGEMITATKSITPIPVEIRSPPLKPFQLIEKIFNSIWGPIETTGIVFIVLIFVLLEHEALRDRFIRLIGKHDLRETTIAVNDAGERLSRFFLSQFGVNIAVGLLIWLGLSVIGLSQALLWGAMAAILRFIPYVGVWIAAVCATLLAAAIAPGWSLALMTISLFFVVELVISQLIEPHLYGHTTGLSPLSVVIAAIFWSWLWGPVGLMLSTPLTLCMVVAGRYISSLNFLEVLLGEIPALTMPENFYQRALAGDAQEIIANARRFLKRKSFSAYCDTVLGPALHLAKMDFTDRAITKVEQVKVSNAIVSVIQELGENRKWWKHYSRNSLLEGINLGLQLRSQRERMIGQWQGPINAPAGSILLSIGLSNTDVLAAEILVRVLRAQHIDARHFSIEEFELPPPPDSTPDIISMVCFVSTDPVKGHQHLESAATKLRSQLPHVKIVAVLLANPFDETEGVLEQVAGADQIVRSYQETLQTCLEVMPVSSTVS